MHTPSRFETAARTRHNAPSSLPVRYIMAGFWFGAFNNRISHICIRLNGPVTMTGCHLEACREMMTGRAKEEVMTMALFTPYHPPFRRHYSQTSLDIVTRFVTGNLVL
jgi:hypothetical protein